MTSSPLLQPKHPDPSSTIPIQPQPQSLWDLNEFASPSKPVDSIPKRHLPEIGLSVLSALMLFGRRGRRARGIYEERVGGQQEAVGDLFGNAPSTTTAYVSPFRSGNCLKPSAPAPSPSKPHRLQILASPTALATATTHKQTGTQHYRLGQYNLAEASYTFAISSLPPQHLLLVPLYNNRALTRLKIGDMGGAIEDCSAVVGIIGDLGFEETGGGVGGKEKWEEAGKVWEVYGGWRRMLEGRLLEKVGMTEVVSPAQVKVRYTKAIANLHPDKLNVNNTTLERRMIANGVFSALNEAWNAFKQ
ncbi:hypothetical protein PILCRDRAFT_12093 [Piloderma croceum F 1598]|uniref:J domain-containing protein n=1 Tax=Piloderma croceum (strain F 1598) TaxID=765440 RepID=A0A0C3BIT3_PILCF|nr:hypothetical protein PILCRDRAFT_12093 [Piloderma croceum F 1598]